VVVIIKVSLTNDFTAHKKIVLWLAIIFNSFETIFNMRYKLAQQTIIDCKKRIKTDIMCFIIVRYISN